MNILLGVTGSIAAYKTPELVRQLVKAGHQVQVILSKSAQQFVTPLSLETVSGNPVFSDTEMASAKIPHLKLTKDQDMFILVPATANTMAKCAQGLADDLISATFLSFTGPKAVVPAMHTEMWQNPITQENLAKLKAHGVHVLGPDSGDLAVGDVGEGRMVAPELVVLFAQLLGTGMLPLQGQKIMITSGGTVEKIDNVRHISNASTGKMGSMMAQLASLQGAQVTLITTVPVSLPNPHLDNIITVASVAELHDAVMAHLPGQDKLYMAAAVSDYTVAEASDTKLKRADAMSLDLTPTEDILKKASQAADGTKVIGFCLEDTDLIARAKDKLARKGADVIVANHASMIGQDKRDVSVVYRDGRVESFNDLSLLALGQQLLRI